MANPVLGKSLCSDWFFLGQDFAVQTVSMETVQSVYFCFGAKRLFMKSVYEVAVQSSSPFYSHELSSQRMKN